MTAQRPRFHFSPPSGWINDPNGLIRVDEVYHIFYQANPHGLVHGPMHWGHATSRDLAIWEEQPLALFPDADGQCFSGSAVAVREGTVADQLGTGDGILMFYTAHLDRPGLLAVETQSVAVADRALKSFRKFAGNPVVANPGLRDFRDPKVIWHASTSRWVMVVTHGQSVGFYSSADALNWRFESEFGVDEGRHGPGPWECPDLFPISVEGSSEIAWILVVGLGRGHVSGGSGTQYFVGDFDGRSFRNRNPKHLDLPMDWGRDYYATQSFSGMAGEAPLAMAWMSNWMYANHTPSSGFRGNMTLPRRLQLATTAAGPRLVQTVDPSAAKQFPRLDLAPGQSASSPPAAYRLQFDWSPAAGHRLTLALFGEPEPILTVQRREAGYVIAFSRSAHLDIAPELEFATQFAFDAEADGMFDLDVFVDHGLVEIGCCGGRHWITNLYFPADPAGPVRLAVE